MTTRLAAKYQVITNRFVQNFTELTRNRERGSDGLQTAGIAVMSVVIAGLVIAAVTAAINSRVGKIK